MVALEVYIDKAVSCPAPVIDSGDQERDICFMYTVLEIWTIFFV